jgi:hypothetical protein
VPEVTPLGRENLSAGTVLGGEEGDDLTEEGVGEGADSVVSSLVLLRCRVPIVRFRFRFRRRRHPPFLVAAPEGRCFPPLGTRTDRALLPGRVDEIFYN